MENILKFEPIYKERVWGGRSIETIYERRLPKAELKYGESWEIVDRPGDQSKVVDGEYHGKTLNYLWNNYREDIFGQGMPDTDRFPLMIKILDARKKLSLQVHPPKSICQILDAEPKTELWYIADAGPGSVIYYGLKNGIDEDEFRKSINEENLHDKIKSFSVKCGDFIFLPSGCLHAIGEDIVIFEIQQNSDTTYRVYDWGRMGIDGKPRTLHQDEALMCIDFEDNEPLMGNYNSGSLVRCLYFNVDILSVRSGDKKKLEKGSRFSIYCLVEGSLDICDQKIKTGDSFILPASENNVPIDFTCNSESKIIRITMPDQYIDSP